MPSRFMRKICAYLSVNWQMLLGAPTGKYLAILGVGYVARRCQLYFLQKDLAAFQVKLLSIRGEPVQSRKGNAILEILFGNMTPWFHDEQSSVLLQRLTNLFQELSLVRCFVEH